MQMAALGTFAFFLVMVRAWNLAKFPFMEGIHVIEIPAGEAGGWVVCWLAGR